MTEQLKNIKILSDDHISVQQMGVAILQPRLLSI